MGRNAATWQELNDPWNEFGTLDFDSDCPTDDPNWWQDQDADMEREELERIETRADMEELRHNGYWD